MLHLQGKQTLSATLGRKNAPKVSSAIQEAVEVVRQKMAGVKPFKALQISRSESGPTKLYFSPLYLSGVTYGIEGGGGGLQP